MNSDFDGYVLIEYHIFRANVLKENKKTYTVYVQPGCSLESETRRIAKDKYVPKTTPFCVVWETWKGVNGRGGYRLETTMYQDKLVIGGGKVTEDEKP